MKARTIISALALCFVTATVCLAQDVQIGTWKLNEAKSKIPAGAPKNHTVIYEKVGDDIKITVDGTTAEGGTIHHEWTGKFDRKDYPVTGDPTSDMRSYRQINARTLTFAVKKEGKVTTTGRVVIARNGKTRTVTTTTTDSQGKKLTTVGVYDKQ